MGPVKPAKSEKNVTSTVSSDSGSVHNADTKNSKNTESVHNEQSFIIQQLLKMEIEGFEPVLPNIKKDKVKPTNKKVVSSSSLLVLGSQSIMTVISSYSQEYPMFVYFLIFLIMTIRYMDLDFVNMFLFFILICYTVQRFSVIELFYLGLPPRYVSGKRLWLKVKNPRKIKRPTITSLP